ncbi:hypothetical protein B0H15DRAFT_1028178, partial [Mycena belliarum]
MACSGLSKDQMRDFSPPSGSNVRLRSSSKCLVFRLAKRGGLCADRNLRLAALRGALSTPVNVLSFRRTPLGARTSSAISRSRVIFSSLSRWCSSSLKLSA